MHSKVLAITGDGNAVSKYRIYNAAEHFFKEMDVLNVAALMDNHDIHDLNKLYEATKSNGVSPESLAIANWAETHGPYDLVWSNDFREDTVILAQFLKSEGAELVADVDDLFTDVPKGNIAHGAWNNLRTKRVYNDLLESADRVTCSTGLLSERFNGKVCPNFIVPDEWGAEHSPNRVAGGRYEHDIVILCAAGMGRGADYLRIEQALRQCLLLTNVKIVFVGWIPDWAIEYPPTKTMFCRWADIGTYSKMMSWCKPDIMISPMVHDDFNIAKSNLKWLEAGMLGACFVGERWGEYKRTVEHGRTGILCDGPDEWKEVLPEICMNRDLREAVARRGADAVNSNWTWPAVKDAWTKGVLGDECSSSGIIRGPDEQLKPAATG